MTHFQDPSADRELRSEVEDLRSEIGSLRDQLNQQIQFFTQERRRWETERGVSTSFPIRIASRQKSLTASATP